MIVRTGDYREVESVSKPDDVRSLLLDHPNALGRCVAQLDCIQPCNPTRLVLRQLGKITGDCENEERHRCGYSDCPTACRIACRIVPITFRIDRERRVDADRDYVFVLVSRLQCWEKNGPIASVRRISR